MDYQLDGSQVRIQSAYNPNISNHGLKGYLSVHPANQPSIKQFWIPILASMTLMLQRWWDRMIELSQFNSTRASLLGQLTRFWKQNYGFLETGEIDTRTFHSHPKNRWWNPCLSAESSPWSQLSAFGEMLHTQGRPLSLATWSGSQGWATKSSSSGVSVQVTHWTNNQKFPVFCLFVSLLLGADGAMSYSVPELSVGVCL